MQAEINNTPTFIERYGDRGYDFGSKCQKIFHTTVKCVWGNFLNVARRLSLHDLYEWLDSGMGNTGSYDMVEEARHNCDQTRRI
jgi:hypothetical protein